MLSSVLDFQPLVLHGNVQYQLSSQSFSVTTETEMEIELLAQLCGVQCVKKSAASKRFSQSREPLAGEYRLLRFDGDVALKRIDSVLKDVQCSGAMLREVLSFVSTLPLKERQQLLLEFDLVALGSLWQGPVKKHGRRSHIPFIHNRLYITKRKKEKRRLTLLLSHGASFTKHDIFLVRCSD